MFSRACCLLLALTLVSCQSPYKKKDQEDAKPLKDQSGDTSFQAFIGRLKIAVAKKDVPMLASMMTPDFGYRVEATTPPGENVFSYWDQNNVWPELAGILDEKFNASDLYMVAPPAFAQDPDNYQGYRAGMRVVGGSWKFAYFVSGPPH